jgi:hypothetical protein
MVSDFIKASKEKYNYIKIENYYKYDDISNSIITILKE